MKRSIERSHINARDVRQMVMAAEDVADYAQLQQLGITFPQVAMAAMSAYAMDDQQGGITAGSITTPVQFLQNWLPGFVKIITAARKADELLGITTTGSWEDEEIVQGILEPVGNALPYGDYSNVPLASWNTNFVRRTVVRFEKGFKVGILEEARAARIRVSTSAEKRNAAAEALEVQRNLIAFNGFNGGNNLTYGMLNDPGLPAYVSAPNGASASPLWSNKTFQEIKNDILRMAAALQNQSQDKINPEDTDVTLAVATVVYQWISQTTDLGKSVRGWITDTYPRMRIVSAPQLNAANGGANVAYMYAERIEDGASDDSRTWVQVVPAKFQALGVEKQAKGYVEDYANATAGVMLKRPYAVTRLTGI